MYVRMYKLAVFEIGFIGGAVKCTVEFYWSFVHTPTEMTAGLLYVPYFDHCVMVYKHCYFMCKCM